MAPIKPLEGRRFGRLVVQSLSKIDSNGHSSWLCLCDCGNEHIVNRTSLIGGGTRSCGCLLRERSASYAGTHGHSANGRWTPTYISWNSMHIRCRYPNTGSYKDYGGRGITVCERWSDFRNFLADMGDRPEDMTLDRIDNDEHYTPDNCRWATRSDQSKNRRPRK